MLTPTIETLTVDPNTSEAWVVLASYDQAKLVRYHSPTRRRCHSEVVDHTESPMPINGYTPAKNTPGNLDRRYAARCKILEEERRRFSRLLFRWLKDIVEQRRLSHITIFAPEKMIRLLDPLVEDLQPARVDLCPGDLTYQSDDKLQRHPAIMGRLEQAGGFPSPDIPLDRPLADQTAGQHFTDPFLRNSPDLSE
jgi:hypothetical protein